MPLRTRGDRPALLIHPLSYIRFERGWSYQDVVNVIARRVRNSAARREKAWRWEHWGVVPDDESQLALADELGVPVEQVRRLGWPYWLPVGERINLDMPWTATGSLQLLDHAAGAAVLDRRGFLTLGVGAAFPIATQWLEIEAPRLAAVQRGGHVDEKLVGCLEQRLPMLRQIDNALGGGSVRSLVDAELRLVTDLLTTSSYSESVGQRLFSIAAELGRQAGWASFDAGYLAAAERYWVAALRAAHTASDRLVGANILKCMSLQYVDTGRVNEARALVRAAREGAKNAPPRVIAMLAVREARILAAHGDVRGCEAMLVEAERAMDATDSGPVPSWAAYFDQAEYSAQVAACYLLLRRHKATNRWLTQSLALQPAERGRDRATYLIWRADALLHIGEVEHACELVGRALPDVAAARSVRNHRRLKDIHTRLAQQHTPAVRALDEQMRTLAVPA